MMYHYLIKFVMICAISWVMKEEYAVRYLYMHAIYLFLIFCKTCLQLFLSKVYCVHILNYILHSYIVYVLNLFNLKFRR